MSSKVGAWLFLKFRLESYTAAAARGTRHQLAIKSFDLQVHANFPTAHQFLWGSEQLPRTPLSWVEGGTSVWVSLSALPPACWSCASLVWSGCLRRKAKTTPGKIAWLFEAVIQGKTECGAESGNKPRSSLDNRGASGDSQQRFFCPLPTSFCRKESPGSTTSSQWWVHNLTLS